MAGPPVEATEDFREGPGHGDAGDTGMGGVFMVKKMMVNTMVNTMVDTMVDKA